MAALAGHPIGLLVSATDGSFVEVDNINNVSFGPSRNMLDITSFKDTTGAKLFMAGLSSGKISLKGDYNGADAPQAQIRTQFLSGGALYVQMHFDTGAAAGSKGYKVKTIVESFDVSVGVDGKVEFSCSLNFNGFPVVDNGAA